ncbi:MAG TPA: hypothetical protein VND65_13795 [Candidatus Binatia bacterium]|nr:hypothetical protein [Candidatus Binatia bacterium]
MLIPVRKGILFLFGSEVVLLTAGAVGQITLSARSAEQFVDSMGINVHMEYAGTPYSDYPAINGQLRALGMKHIRDEINDTDPEFVRELLKIGTLGYGVCGLIEGGNDYPPLGARLQASAVVPMIQNLRPAIDAIEGPNEPDDGGFVYDGVAYPQGAIEESEDLWNTVKSSSEISDLPVLVMSEGNAQDYMQLAAITPPPIGYANFGNMHAYQGGRMGNYALRDWYIRYSRDLTGDAPLWTTEMGYHNNTHYLSDGEQQGVSERASAIYLPIAFLSGFDLGVARTFSYELMDEVNDPELTSGSGEGHYGLLHYDGSPKPAYTALQSLIAVLRDSGPNFEPGSLRVTFAGAPKSLQAVLLEKSDGAYYLALWNDVPVYRPATTQARGEDLYPPNVPVKITVSETRQFTVYAPNDRSGANPTGQYTIATKFDSIELALPAEVLLVRIAAR